MLEYTVLLGKPSFVVNRVLWNPCENEQVTETKIQKRKEKIILNGKRGSKNKAGIFFLAFKSYACFLPIEDLEM